MHQPYFRNGKNSNVAFLFVHGILSSPRHFDWLIQQIPEDYAISNILLAGHGGNVEDFSRANMQQWKNQFECALTELKKSYRSIIVVGHSLGALLALHASTRHKSISGMLLLNPPLQPQLMPSMMWRSIRFAFDKVHLDDPNDISCFGFTDLQKGIISQHLDSLVTTIISLKS